MPPLNSRETRRLVRERNKIEGAKSLHRGIHYNQNEDAARQFKSNSAKTHANHRDLLVHHQKISADLQEVYKRTAALHHENATMEERIEESWRQFEAIGGKRPRNARQRGQDASLCVNQTAVPYAERLKQVSMEKKDLRQRASWERETRGEAVDYGRQGSALHAAKDKRIELFQRRQLKRAHLLRRVGDPTPMKQSGRYDSAAGTLQVFNKTMRQVRREVAQDARVSAVHERRKGSRSVWDVTPEGNVNRPGRDVLTYSREWELGPARKKRRT